MYLHRKTSIRPFHPPPIQTDDLCLFELTVAVPTRQNRHWFPTELTFSYCALTIELTFSRHAVAKKDRPAVIFCFGDRSWWPVTRSLFIPWSLTPLQQSTWSIKASSPFFKYCWTLFWQINVNYKNRLKIYGPPRMRSPWIRQCLCYLVVSCGIHGSMHTYTLASETTSLTVRQMDRSTTSRSPTSPPVDDTTSNNRMPQRRRAGLWNGRWKSLIIAMVSKLARSHLWRISKHVHQATIGGRWRRSPAPMITRLRVTWTE